MIGPSNEPVNYYRVTLNEKNWVSGNRPEFRYDVDKYEVILDHGWVRVFSKGGVVSEGTALQIGVVLKEAWPEAVVYRVELIETDDE